MIKSDLGDGSLRPGGRVTVIRPCFNQMDFISNDLIGQFDLVPGMHGDFAFTVFGEFGFNQSYCGFR